VTTALVTGAGGQDGVLLCRLLVRKGIRAVGMVRSATDRERLEALAPGTEPIDGDVTDRARLAEVLAVTGADQVYNLAAISSVGRSWQLVDQVMAVNTIGVLNLLETVREVADRTGRPIRFYQASSSEMFGLPTVTPQDENTNFHPRSPYAVSKLAAHHLTINYRESYGLFACSGILYNHESTLRETHFVTRKITQAVAAIALGKQDELVLGNIDVRRDWGHAEDYVQAMWRMLQHDVPGDYVVATGRSRSLTDFLAAAFTAAGIQDWRPFVRSDPALQRPVEVGDLVGDAGKARRLLGWTPTFTFEDLVSEMVEADLRLLRGA
jgi:GDPmannose 4,6-dehydratase